MTNHEKYKQAFSALHASHNISLEGNTMKKTNLKFRMRPALAACLCVVLLVACMSMAYAADVGGIQEILKVWIHGQQVNAKVVDNSGNGNGSYEFVLDMGDEEGDVVIHGGGVACEEDGSERPLSPEEVAEGIFSDEITKKPDGTVWLYYYDQSFNITDYLKNGACKVVLEDQGKKLYFNIEDNGGDGYAYQRSSVPTGAPEDYIELK